MPETISNIDKALGGAMPPDGVDSTTMAEAPVEQEQAEVTSPGETNDNAHLEKVVTKLSETVATLAEVTKFGAEMESLRTEFAKWKTDSDPAISRLGNDSGGSPTPKFDAQAALSDPDLQLAWFIEGLAGEMEKHSNSFSLATVKAQIADWKKDNLPHYDETTSQLTDMGQTPSLNRTLTIALEPMLRMRQWFTADRGTPTTGERQYPVIGQLAVSAFGENANVPTLGAIPVSYVNVTQTKFGGEILITGETRRFSDIPYMQMVRRVVLSAMARFHEAKGRDALLNAEAVTGATMAAAAADWGTSTKSEAAAGSNTFAFEAAPFAHRRVLQVSSVVYDPLGAITGPITLTASDYLIDYYDGIIKLTAGGTNDIGGATNTLPARVDLNYVFVNEVPGTNEADFGNAHLIEAETAGTLAWEDAVNARGQVKGADADANVLWTDPDKGVDILKDSNFITGGAGMAEQTVMQGAITRIGGLNLFESTIQYPGIAAVFMAMDLGYESIGSDVQSRTYVPDNRVDDQNFAVQMLNAFAVTRPEVISIVFNAQDNAAFAPAV